MSDSAWILPLVFLTGALSGALLGWTWRGRRMGANPTTRPRSWPLVLATALLTTLALGAVGYGFLRHRFQPTQVTKPSMRGALADYHRSARTDTRLAPGKAPPGGVYTYLAEGFYEAELPVLGKERRVLPKAVPGILVPDGDCWELTHRYFEQHHWTGRFCQHPTEGLRLEWVRNKNEMFSMKSESRSSCEPHALLPRGQRVGQPWTLSCTSDPPRRNHGAAKPEMLALYIGEEAVPVDGRPRPARRFRRSFSMKGAASGSMTQDFWLSSDSGLLLRLEVKGGGEGMGKFVTDYRLVLGSLTPRR